MEDFQLDIVIGKGPSARSIRLDLPALHARRRHHPHRPDHRPAARPLRVRRPPRLLRHRRPRRDHRARRRASSACRSSTAGAQEIARRSRGTPRIANRLLKRVRDYAEVRADGAVTTDDRARRAGAVRGRRARPRQGRPRHPRARCARRSAASRSASTRWRWRWRRSPRRSRRSTSRSCSRRACCSARPGGGSPRPGAYAHLGTCRRRDRPPEPVRHRRLSRPRLTACRRLPGR